MAKTIALIGALDAKGKEFDFLKSEIEDTLWLVHSLKKMPASTA
ncbi:MAG: hypothetical protein V3S66_01360 [Desulfobacterales bacterium]